MMPNIVRGDRMAGLMVYLVGPGRANEHEDPHLVAGDGAAMAWHDDNELNRDSALEIARHLDRPHKALGVEVGGGHVWHCSLSLPPDEGELSDEQWGQIAHDFIHGMELDDNEGTKAPCRWVAVRHGLAKNGGDHIHLAVSLVREDGTKAVVHRDYNRAQQVTRELEVKHGLEQLESRAVGRATRGYKPGEREAAARRKARGMYERQRRLGEHGGPPWARLGVDERQQRIAAAMKQDSPRYCAGVRVRGAAAASRDEAEFVRRMRRGGLLVRPRFADGRSDVVTGFSVAERPPRGERPIWYGGGRLARDLTLPRLRAQQGWLDTPTGAAEAVAEWTAARRGRRVVAPGREAQETDPQAWERCNAQVREAVTQLRSVDLDDRDTWVRVARETSGVLAAWSNAVEDEPGDLAAAANTLSQSAQTYARPQSQKTPRGPRLTGVAGVVATAARGGKGRVSEVVMMRQMLRLTQAVHAANVAAGQARHAQRLAHDTRIRLVKVRNALSQSVPDEGPMAQESVAHLAPELQARMQRVRASQARPAGEAAEPLPGKLPTERKATTSPKTPTRRGPGRGE